MIFREGRTRFCFTFFILATEKGNACETEIVASGKEDVGRRP